MKTVQTTDGNVEAYRDLVGQLDDKFLSGSVDLDQFQVQDEELFLTIVDNHCYRPGYKEKYGSRDGKIFFVDDLNENEVIIYDLTVDQFLAMVNKAFG